jgi:transcriptional regulator with XRE-family HTH domain
MKELRDIIASNICDLRAKKGITQFELAKAVNYSDKAVSKWERGESVPEISVLKQVADYFGVTVDYLLTQNHEEYDAKQKIVGIAHKKNRAIITSLAFMLVWLVATFLFVQLNALFPYMKPPTWCMFVYAVPVSFTVLLILNSVWGKRKINFVIISVIVWSLLLCVYLSLVFITQTNFWLLFLIGVPAQVIILLWSGLKKID